MERRVVDLKFKGKVVGKATVEVGDNGVHVVSTEITDPEVKKLTYADQSHFSVVKSKRKKES